MKAMDRSSYAAGMIKMALHTRLAHWGIVFLLIFAGGILWLLKPTASHLNAVRKEIAETKSKLSKVKGVSEVAHDFDSVMDQLETELQSLEGRVLKAGEQAKVVAALTRATEQAGITVLRMTPYVPVEAKAENQEKPEGAIRPVYFELEALSRYRNLGEFFAQLAAGPLALTVEEFEAVSQAENSVLLNVRMMIAAYEGGVR